MACLFANPYSPAAWIEVSGEDAFAFLQGQFSNNLAGAAPGAATYGLWLNAKGGLEGDSLVLREGDERFLLLSRHTPAATLLERLNAYIFADDVTLSSRTGTVGAYALWGSGAGALLEELGWAAPACGEFGGYDSRVWVVPSWWSRGEAFEIIVASDDREEVGARIEEKLSRRDGGCVEESAYHFERIRSGVPAPLLDLAAGTLPQEGRLERIAVSYDKGCYTGQEVMARLRNKGRMRRLLMAARLESSPPAWPCAVYYQGREVGKVVSAGASGSEWLGFVLLERPVAEQAERLSLQPESVGGIRLLKPQPVPGDGS